MVHNFNILSGHPEARMLSLEKLTLKELYTIILSKITDIPTSRELIEKITCTKNLYWNKIYILIESSSIDKESGKKF